MSKSPAFLDTTIFVDLSIESTDIKNIVEKHLEQFLYTITSHFVGMEFKATVLQDAKLAHDVVRLYNSVVRAMDHLRKITPKRKGQRAFSILLELLKTYGNIPCESESVEDREIVQDILDALENFIDINEKLFQTTNDFVDKFGKGCNCTRGKDKIEKTKITKSYKTFLPKCSKKNRHCSIREFWNEHFDILKDFVEKVINNKSASKGEHDLAAKVIKYLDKKDTPFTHTECRSVGDIIIALEAAKGLGEKGVLATSNVKDFQTICNIISIGIYDTGWRENFQQLKMKR